MSDLSELLESLDRLGDLPVTHRELASVVQFLVDLMD